MLFKIRHAFITLLLFVKIPDIVKEEQKASFGEIAGSIIGGVSFLKTNRGILILLLMYSILEFMGAVSFDSYSTYQTVILREKVSISMQGRIFSLQGMITGMLSPVGYLAGAFLADYVCEPFMQKGGTVQEFLSVFLGSGKGAGIGLIFVAAGLTGMIILVFLCHNRKIKELDEMEI